MEVSGTLPVLVSVTVCAVESCPESVSGKASEVAERVSVAEPVPVPPAPSSGVIQMPRP